jgi:hypothetical protein
MRLNWLVVVWTSGAPASSALLAAVAPVLPEAGKDAMLKNSMSAPARNAVSKTR